MNIIKELKHLIENRKRASNSFTSLPDFSKIKPKGKDSISLENNLRLLAMENERMRKGYEDLQQLFTREDRILNENTVNKLTELVNKANQQEDMNSDLNQSIKNKEEEIAVLNEKIELLDKNKEVNGIRVYVTKIQDLEKRVKELKENRAKDDGLKQYQHKDNSLEVSNLLKNKLEQTTKVLNKIQREKSLLITENVNLRSQLEKMRKSSETPLPQKDEDNRLYDELSEIKSQIHGLKEQRDDDRAKSSLPNIEQVERKEENKSNFDILYMENQKLKDQLSKLESDVKESKKQANELKTELASKDYKVKIDQLETRNLDLSDKLTQKQKEVERLESEIRDLSKAKGDLEGKLMITQSQIAENQNQLAKEMEKDSALYKQILTKSRKFDYYDDDMDDEGILRKKSRKYTLETEELINSLKKKINDTEKEYNDLKKENNDLRVNTQISESKQKMEIESKNQKIEYLKEKLSDLKENLIKKENDMKNLESKLDQVTRESKEKIKEIKMSVEKDSQLQFERLKAEQERLNQKERILKDFRQGLINNANTDMGGNFEPIHNSLYDRGRPFLDDEIREHSVQLNNNIQASNVNKMRSVVKELMNKLNDNGALLDEKEKKIIKLKREKEKNYEEREALINEKTLLETNHENLQKKFRNQEKLIERLKGEIAASEAELEELQKTLSSKKSELRESSRMLIKAEEAEDNNEYFKEVIEQQEADIETLTQKLDETELYLQKMIDMNENQEPNEQDKNLLKKLRNENKKLKRALGENKQVLISLEEKYIELKQLMPAYPLRGKES